MIRGHLIDTGPCPYLPDRRFSAFVPQAGAPPYRELMDLGFRRSGASFYRPLCDGCQECRPLRIDTAAFRPRSDQRRCAKRNADLSVAWAPRGWDDERAALHARYQREIHGKDADDEPGFTEDAGVDGGELHVRDRDGRLLGFSVVDRFADALSSVYCTWDPDHRERGLGTFLALAEIAWCQAHQRRWWYPGFLVRGCAAMAYKERFGPNQLLIEGRWQDCNT